MASFYSNFDKGFRLRLDISRVSEDTLNNKSTINWTLYVESGSYYFANYVCNINLNIDGITAHNSSKQRSLSGANTLTKIESGSTIISHSADGSKTFVFNVSFETNTKAYYTPAGVLKISDSYTLPTIPRASTPTLSASRITYNSKITINTNRKSDSFTHSIRANWNGIFTTLATGVETSYVWTIPLSWVSRIPNNSSTTGTIYLDTFNGDTLIGTKSVALTTVVPDTLKPTVNNINISEYVDKVKPLGVFVEGKSRLSISVSGAGSYGSTIKKYQIIADGQSFSSPKANTEVISKAGTLSVTARVTDSRGRTGTKTQSIEVLPYEPPKIKNFYTYRSSPSGNADSKGIYSRSDYSVSWAPLNSKNTKKLELQYKKVNDTAWTTLNLTANSYEVDSYRIVSGIDSTSSYNFRLVASDYFENSSAIQMVPTGFVTMDFKAGGRGVGIGRVAESDALEIGMLAKFFNNIELIDDGAGTNIYFRATTGDYLRIGKASIDDFFSINAMQKTNSGGDFGLNFYTGTGRFTHNGQKIITQTDLGGVEKSTPVSGYIVNKWLNSNTNINLEDASFYLLIVTGGNTHGIGYMGTLSTTGGYIYRHDIKVSGVSIGHSGLTLMVNPLNNKYVRLQLIKLKTT